MNHVTVIGRLSADPTSRTVNTRTGDRTVTTVPLAIPTGRDHEPCWIDVICWDSLAEACAAHLAKGRQVAVHGRLELTRWTTDDGARRQVHRIVASDVEFFARPASPAFDPDPDPGANAGAPLGDVGGSDDGPAIGESDDARPALTAAATAQA